MALASPAPDELQFAASLFNPNDGETTWAGSGRYLIGVGSTFLVGPNVSLFDLGEVDGGSFGVAFKWRVGKTSGFWIGGGPNKLTGDAADIAKYTLDAQAGADFGGPRGFVTVYAQQTWAQDEQGNTTSPEGTSVIAGIGLRFGKN